MDKFELNPLSDRFKQVSAQNVQSQMASLRNQKDLGGEEKDEVDLERDRQLPRVDGSDEGPARDPQPAPRAEKAPAPQAPASGDDYESRLLHELPEEVRKAASQVIKAQMDKRSRPSASLLALKNAERMDMAENVEGCTSVVDAISEDATPLPLEDSEG